MRLVFPVAEQQLQGMGARRQFDRRLSLPPTEMLDLVIRRQWLGVVNGGIVDQQVMVAGTLAK